MNYHRRDPFAGTVFAQDRVDFRSAASAFKRAANLVKRYGARLRKIARDIDSLVKHYDMSTAEGQALFQAAVLRYRADNKQYAERSADKMLAQVAKADERSWRSLSAEIGRGVEKAIASAPIAPVIARMKDEQVERIQSIPTHAIEHVHKLVVEGLSTGRRAEDIADEIVKTTGNVSKSDAMRIARTETGRASTTLLQARAEHVGSEGYIWRTAGDYDVRPSHKAMNGRFVRWDSPPTLDGLTGHAGALPNCRCFCSPQVPDFD